VFRSKTVLVVGAGASCEAKFPDGKSLLHKIGSALDLTYEFNHLKSGDHEMSQAILHLTGAYNDEFNEYLHRGAWRIRDASKVALSIDNIIEQHDDEAKVAEVAKIAIVQAILRAEAKSSLAIPPDKHPDTPIHAPDGSWFGFFGQLLTEGLPRRLAERLFENLSIICFNYDRAIEHYLPHALVASWGMSLGTARELVSTLKILHPYGKVAPLEWQKPNTAVTYGRVGGVSYVDLASNIRTFSERVEDEAALAELRSTMAEAERTVFLGFAFHRQNMELLRPEGPVTRQALATVYGLPENEQREIEKQLRGMLRLASGIDGLVLHDGTCGTLFSDNWRTISA
jgi:hypothetical protein